MLLERLCCFVAFVGVVAAAVVSMDSLYLSSLPFPPPVLRLLLLLLAATAVEMYYAAGTVAVAAIVS